MESRLIWCFSSPKTGLFGKAAVLVLLLSFKSKDHFYKKNMLYIMHISLYLHQLAIAWMDKVSF